MAATEAALAALRERIEKLEEVQSYGDVEPWRNETKGVLRGIFGVRHPAIEELDQIRFTGIMGGDEKALVQGRETAAGLLRGLLRELELS